MVHELHLDQSYNTHLTPKDRNTLIRYCISIGTRAKCSTRNVLRPFKQKYLTTAIREMKSSHLEQIAKFKEQINLYQNDELKLSDWLIDFFEGTPSKEDFKKYMRALIKQERDVFNTISKSYVINVDFSHISKELLEFHNTLNPRITFGYSSILHEECDFELSNEIKHAFLNSSLKELPTWEQDWTHDWGYVFFDSIINLLYEDLIVFCGERCILDTISHEQCMTINLTDEEFENFINFEGNKKEKSEILEKLKSISNGEN
ncbi:MAG: hypothetical protein K2L12_02245 [Clostridia bacterium]|nr:hypothetical protein [Clostridia bacterium]